MKRALFLIALVFLSLNSMAMRGGYSKQIEALFDLLPQLNDQFSNSDKETLLLETSLFPQSNTNIADSKLGDAAKEALRDYGIINTYQFSDPECLPIFFKLLSDAIEAKNKDEIAIWISSISYNTSTAVSAFYEAPILYAQTTMVDKHFKAFTNGKDKFTFNGSSSTILESALLSDVGLPRRQKFIKSFKPALLSESEDEIYDIIAPISFQLISEKQKHLKVLSKNINENLFSSKNDIRNGQIALVYLSQVALKQSANIINTAYYYAKNDYDLQNPKRSTASKIGKKLFADYDISKDATFGHLFAKNDTKEKFVGLIIEAQFSPFGSATGMPSNIIAGCMAEALKDEKIAFKAIDLRTAKKLPSPKEMPVLIFPAHKFESFYSIRKTSIERGLKKYTKNGGRLIIVGDYTGAKIAALKPLNNARIFDNDNMVFKADKIKRAGFVLYESPLKKPTTVIKTISNAPLSRGHFASLSTMNFKTDENIKALLKVSNRKYSAICGAVATENGKPTHAQLATYTLMPFIVDTAVTSVAPLKFDSFSKKVFINTVKLLNY